MAEKRQDSGFQYGGFNEFEQQLMAIAPQAARLDRATMLFRAGQESVQAGERRVRRTARCWAAATILLAFVAIGLSWRVYRADGIRVVEKIRNVPSLAERQLVPDADFSTSTVNEPRKMPADLKANTDPRNVGTAHVTPRNHYLNQRRLAMTMGLDALADPPSFGGSGMSGTCSYRELKVSILDFDASSAGARGNSNSTRADAAHGDRT